jgi:DNA-binding CsgD family transcriptional regulator
MPRAAAHGKSWKASARRGGGGDPANTRNIANRLQIGIKTVQAYCARIKDKLNLANATQLLREAIRWTESNAF